MATPNIERHMQIIAYGLLVLSLVITFIIKQISNFQVLILESIHDKVPYAS